MKLPDNHSEEEESFFYAVKGANVGLWDWKLDADTLYWSNSFKDIMGLKYDEIKPSLIEFADRLHPDDNSAVTEALDRCLNQGKIYDIEYRLKHAKGHYIWIHAKGTLFKDEHGKKTRISGTVEDISDKKKSQDELKESQELINLINDNMPDALFVKDEDLRIVRANKLFINMYPKDKQNKVIGYTTLEDYKEEDVIEFTKLDRIAFEYGSSEAQEKITFPNGDVKTLFTKKVRFEDSKGEKFILGLCRDITNIKDIEKEREELISKLTNSNAELANFAFICSHDLQEPLRMIRSFSGKIKEKFGDVIEADPNGKIYLKFITDSAENAQNLITDILSYSDINNDLKPKEDINLDSLLMTIKTNFEEQDDTISVDYAEMPVIKAHKTQIFQILNNIIGNGVKYRRSDQPSEIKIEVKNLYKHWQFKISDNGIGIDKKHIDKIFKIFKRLHHKDQYKGTGIGLSICKKAVENHNGKIWVESKLGQGSDFYFTIEK